MNLNGNRENNEFDENWSLPSEAEQKVIEARRERNNKISSLMGQYLLKGYKMLATTCSICDCVLLEDRRGQKYCIGCTEVDADTKKDNPAVSEHAARRTVEESQHRNAIPNSDSDGPELTNTNIDDIPMKKVCISPFPPSRIGKFSFSFEIDDLLMTLKRKLNWASKRLDSSSDVKQCSDLLTLINDIVKTIKNLQEFDPSN